MLTEAELVQVRECMTSKMWAVAAMQRLHPDVYSAARHEFTMLDDTFDLVKLPGTENSYLMLSRQDIVEEGRAEALAEKEQSLRAIENPVPVPGDTIVDRTGYTLYSPN